jgi:hypothetical protein
VRRVATGNYSAAGRAVTKISEGRWSGPTCARAERRPQRQNPGLCAAKTSGNSHCTPTGTAATLAEIVKRAHEPPIIGVCCSSKSRRPRTEGPTQ